MKPSVKYGLVVAGTGILISLLSFLFNLDKSDAGTYIGWLNIPIMIVFMVVAVRETRRTNEGGFISYGQAFKTVAVMVLISAAITAVYFYLYLTVINPTFMDYIREKQVIQMEDRGMSDEQIQAAMKMSGKFMSSPGFMSIASFVSGIVMGLIVGAIVSAIVKKPDPNQIS